MMGFVLNANIIFKKFERKIDANEVLAFHVFSFFARGAVIYEFKIYKQLKVECLCNVNF